MKPPQKTMACEVYNTNWRQPVHAILDEIPNIRTPNGNEETASGIIEEIR
jgi:hypothetical protein